MSGHGFHSFHIILFRWAIQYTLPSSEYLLLMFKSLLSKWLLPCEKDALFSSLACPHITQLLQAYSVRHIVRKSKPSNHRSSECLLVVKFEHILHEFSPHIWKLRSTRPDIKGLSFLDLISLINCWLKPPYWVSFMSDILHKAMEYTPPKCEIFTSKECLLIR